MNFDIKTKPFNECFLPSMMDDFDLKSTKEYFLLFILLIKYYITLYQIKLNYYYYFFFLNVGAVCDTKNK